MVAAAFAVLVAGGVVIGSGIWPVRPAQSSAGAGVASPRGVHGPPPPPGTGGLPAPVGGATGTNGTGGTPPTGNGSSGGDSSGSSGGGSGPNLTAPGGPVLGGTNHSSPSYVGINGTYVAGNVSRSISPAFFQLVLQTPTLAKPSLWAQMNLTPFSYYEFGDATETTNEITDTPYANNGSALIPSQSNDSNFVIFCRAVHCHAILGLPTEIDNVSMAVATVQYVQQTLGFVPDYWMLGGEPQGWRHWGIDWPNWQTTDNSTPTPLQYAQEVQSYVTALKRFDPAIRLIGIESADGGKWYDSPWLDEVAAIDGRNLTALAIHPYPDGVGNSNSSLRTFLSTVTNPLNFPNNFGGLQAHMDVACGCSLPLWVGEYNAALEGNYSVEMSTYPEVPYIAAGLIGAMKAGVQQLDFFSYSHGNESLVATNGSPLPIFQLFTTFLKNLTLGSLSNSTIVGGPGGVVAATLTNGSHSSIVIVSTNVTEALNLTLVPTGGPFLSGGWSAWWWSPSAAAPSRASGTTYLPLTWEVPALGVLLVNLD